jgi:hypothetical protein
MWVRKFINIIIISVVCDGVREDGKGHDWRHNLLGGR